MQFSTISAIRRGLWLLDAGWVQEHAQVIIAAMEGKGTFDSIVKDQAGISVGGAAGGGDLTASVVATTEQGQAYNVSQPYQLQFLPDGTKIVAVIKISGPILREGDCSMGLSDYARILRACEASSKISAMVLDINSPGGEVSGTASFAQLVRSCTKPIVGMVDDGMAASAAIWIGSACKELYATTGHSSFGSIGAYCTFGDFTEAYKKAGIKLIEVYAPQSKDKNADYKAALDGDTTAIEARLGEVVDAFIGDVKAGRAGKLNETAGNPFTGKMYNSKEAQKLGLIDGVRTPNEVFSRALELSKKSSSTPNKTPMANTKQYANIATAAGWEAGHESTEDGLHLTHEDAAAIDTALAAGTQAATDLATATAAGTKATTDLATANTRVTELEAANATLTTANVALGKKSAAPTNLPAEKDEATEGPKATAPVMDETTAQAMRAYQRNNPKT